MLATFSFPSRLGTENAENILPSEYYSEQEIPDDARLESDLTSALLAVENIIAHVSDEFV